MRPAKKAEEAVNCLSCGGSVQAQLSAPEFAFSHAPDGAGPQNTGVSGLDLEVDRVIGREAEQQWAKVAARQDRKHQVLAANPGATGFDLSRTPDGDYRVMQPDERKAAETARGLHQEAQSEILKTKKGKDWLASRVTGAAGP